ncbi:MAG: ammonia-forming cytochrome c nitrite reductase subunit c552 [Candidatus Marinimicrobia bacterium]|nr:ammonia-forming cytochrome c nitrite reductase subunit c552 [Candidatus Neomarinimicrobiota bacterium]
MKNHIKLIIGALVISSILTILLLININERKSEVEESYKKLVKVTEDDTDPEKWGINWPKQYDSYKLTAEATKTRYGGHGGSEALPEQKIERDPWLKRMFKGYAFSIDYRDRRGHAYMLEDQEQTKRQTKPQSGSCLHCHASIMPLYRELGNGNAIKGFEKTHQYSYEELNGMLHESGHGHPVSCVDCHEPNTMKLRVTRPGFIQGIQALANSTSQVSYLPSIERWRESSQTNPYDPNESATQTEMRSFVCAQCHVEYYCGSEMTLEFPWSNGLKAEDLEKHWNETHLPDGKRFFDYKHKESGAEILKVQHPEFELWSQGIHARSGVACADCHMPYQRDGASKISDHWVRSPLLNINNACQTCHHINEEQILKEVDIIQDRNYKLLKRGGESLMALLDAIQIAKDSGATQNELKEALEFQRKAQWRLDYIAAENSMGFHAPQEAARILGEAIDYARQGQVKAMSIK